jgi:hypothetical protein
MLSSHQLFHLNAVLAEAQETRNLSTEKKSKWMDCKQVKDGEYDKYLDAVVKDVNEIIKSDIFPNLECASAIHDYLEKETKEEFKNG